MIATLITLLVAGAIVLTASVLILGFLGLMIGGALWLAAFLLFKVVPLVLLVILALWIYDRWRSAGDLRLAGPD